MIINFKNKRTGVKYVAIECGLFMYDIGQEGYYIDTMHWWDMEKYFENGIWEKCD